MPWIGNEDYPLWRLAVASEIILICTRQITRTTARAGDYFRLTGRISVSDGRGRLIAEISNRKSLSRGGISV